jgi:hypothetical protein
MDAYTWARHDELQEAAHVRPYTQAEYDADMIGRDDLVALDSASANPPVDSIVHDAA